MQHIGPVVNNVLNGVVPILKESCFDTHGMLTPDEFVEAGDELIGKCGTWSWSIGNYDSIISYLPENKQYLVCRNVPEQFNNNIKELDESNGWTECNLKQSNNIQIIDDDVNEINISNEIDEIDESLDEDISDEDDLCIVKNDDLNTNRYDISITYDNYYRTPQVWIIGYNPDRTVIHPLNLLNNISSDHTNKTATIESHPHNGIRQLSVHPCRHSQTMLALVKQSQNKYNVKNSMFLFIKIISTIIPNINYDFTINI
jgi:ubiquitin-like-conjugating enzyme ATG3